MTDSTIPLSDKYIYIQCEECYGEGRVMEMKCYGGMPVERWYDCTKCDSNGEIAILESDYIIEKLKGTA